MGFICTIHQQFISVTGCTNSVECVFTTCECLVLRPADPTPVAHNSKIGLLYFSEFISVTIIMRINSLYLYSRK